MNNPNILKSFLNTTQEELFEVLSSPAGEEQVNCILLDNLQRGELTLSEFSDGLSAVDIVKGNTAMQGDIKTIDTEAFILTSDGWSFLDLNKGQEDTLKKKKQKKIELVMKEFKEGKLHSSSGELVTDREQALAIALSSARELKD